MKKLKGFPKLTLQIAVLSVSMMALSFLTETEIWTDYFCYVSDGMDVDRGENFDEKWYSHRYSCNHFFCDKREVTHIHWNYRGWIYFLTGVVYFIVAVFRIINSHNEEDFQIKK